jgi:hypothetical protein
VWRLEGDGSVVEELGGVMQACSGLRSWHIVGDDGAGVGGCFALLSQVVGGGGVICLCVCSCSGVVFVW